MAGNTIAKLAVVVTTDTGPLSSGMNQAGNIVNRSARQMEGGFSGLADRLKLAKDAAGASTGSIRDMAGVLRAGPWGLAAAGVAGFAVAMYKSAAAADALEMRAVKVADAWEEAHEKLTGQKIDIGFNKIDTWTGQWERLKEAAVQFFGVIGENSGTLSFFKDMTTGLANALEKITEAMRTDKQRAENAELKRLEAETEEKKKQAEIQKKMAEDAEAAAKKLADERTRAWEGLQRTAESITKSLRTPDEIFRDTVTELKNLAGQGLLTGETLARGVRKAAEDLDAAKNRMNGTARAADTRVGAVERFTMAGFSAVQRTSEAKKLEEAAVKTAKHSEKHTELLGEISRDIKATSRSSGLTVSSF